MARRISSSSQALLGLLTIEPMSGYDLGQNVRMSVGHIWSESYGQIYPNLKKLHSAGLVSSRTAKQKGKPERRVYSITRKGRDQFVQWLATPPQPEVPRNEMLLKLFFGLQVSASVLVVYVERMVQEHRALLERFHRVEHEEIAEHGNRREAAFWRMTARYGQLEMQAHLRWAEETLALLRRFERQKKKSTTTKTETHNGRH